MPVRAKSINWTREELILALNLYFEVGNAGPTNRQVIELARLFQQLGFSRDKHGNVAARTEDSVAMKLGNFRHLDPSHPKVGLNKSTTKDEVVWNEFAGNRDRLALAVADLLARGVNPLGPQPVLARRVALEAYNTYDMSPAVASASIRTRDEAELVNRYAEYLRSQGHDVDGRLIAGVFRVDLYDYSENTIIEAKSTIEREAIRMAVGQLLDYRFSDPATSHHLAVLLPSMPPGNAIEFLRSLSIRLIYPGSGFWPVDY